MSTTTTKRITPKMQQVLDALRLQAETTRTRADGTTWGGVYLPGVKHGLSSNSFSGVVSNLMRVGLYEPDNEPESKGLFGYVQMADDTNRDDHRAGNHDAAPVAGCPVCAAVEVVEAGSAAIAEFASRSGSAPVVEAITPPVVGMFDHVSWTGNYVSDTAKYARHNVDARERKRAMRNFLNRERNAALRELCGTSSRAAREDMGL